jgi:hypothetical protein
MTGFGEVVVFEKASHPPIEISATESTQVKMSSTN